MNKRLLFLVVVFAAFATAAFAQPRAVGARLGYGIGVTYQHSFGESNMLSADLGWAAPNGMDLAATYDWIFPIQSWQNKGTWNWFAGVGLNGGFYYDKAHAGDYWASVSSGWIGAAGRIGVEYNFWFPLQLAIDWRPVIGPTFYNHRDSDGYRESWAQFNTGGLYVTAFTLSVRYRF